MALDIDDVLAEEERYLAPQVGPPAPPNALCLSGGGIRSATFCLGALQGLAQSGKLGNFHYLSTVSGGGYIGSWLSAWIARTDLPTVEAALAGSQGGPEPDAVRRLRSYTNYLSPVWGLSLDMLALIAIFLRNLLLHWLVLLPLLTAVLMLPRLHLAVLYVGEWKDGARVCAGLAVALLVMTIAYMASDLPASRGKKPIKQGPPTWVAWLKLKGWKKTARAAQRACGFIRRDCFILCCFLPLLVCALLLSCAMAWDKALLSDNYLTVVLAGAGAHGLGVFLGSWMREIHGMPPRDLKHWLAGIAIIASGAGGGWVLHWLSVMLPDLTKHPLAQTLPNTLEAHALHACFVVPALLFTFWLGVTIYAGVVRSVTEEEDREWWARAAGWWLGAAVGWALVWLVVLEVPRGLMGLAWLQKPSGAQAASLGAGLLGALTAAIGFWSRSGPGIEKKFKGVFAVLGSRALEVAALAFALMLAVLLSYAASCLLRQGDSLHAAVEEQWRDPQALQKVWVKPPETKPGATPDPAAAKWGLPAYAPLAVKALVAYEVVLEKASLPAVWICGWSLLLVALVGSLTLGSNTFSLHSLYVNRLVRAYLGASRDERFPHHFMGFDPEDDIKFRKLRKPKGQGRRLFHVVNTALNLTRPAGDRLEWQERKAASFTMSPLHCGSAALQGGGFVRTARYGERKGGLSLGRALGISGAAASPNMGYHSSPFVAFAMAVFNVRLGWWSPNPLPAFRKQWQTSEPADALQALVSEVVGATDANGSYLYLSDGGHFENLGLYEMVRRRCQHIVVVDATCDSKYEFGDLQSAVNKARVDFGVDIEFTTPLPTPAHAQASGLHHALATIRYPAHAGGLARVGELIYIKPVLDGKEPLDVAAYARSHANEKSPFPHQSTAEQFFDQSQFEAYRMLGLHAMKRALGVHAGGLAGAGLPVAPKPAGAGAPAEALAVKPGSGSSAALLWSGIAGIGGALAITGSVVLKDGHVTLRQPAQVEIKQPVSAEPAASAASSPPTIDIVNKLQQQVDVLNQQMNQQSQVLVNQGGAQVDLHTLESHAASAVASLQGVQGELRLLRGELSGDAELRWHAAEKQNAALWRVQRDMEASQLAPRPPTR